MSRALLPEQVASSGLRQRSVLHVAVAAVGVTPLSCPPIWEDLRRCGTAHEQNGLEPGGARASESEVLEIFCESAPLSEFC